MHRSDSAPLMLVTLCRWFVVCCVLLGLCGQLLLQSHALPDEAPRATLERLTGLHIGPPPLSVMPPMHHMAGHRHGMMPMETHKDQSGQSGHHHDGSCPLCPLLHLPAIIFSVAFVAALILLAWSRSSYDERLPRAPPLYPLALRPPPTGPPAFL